MHSISVMLFRKSHLFKLSTSGANLQLRRNSMICTLCLVPHLGQSEVLILLCPLKTGSLPLESFSSFYMDRNENKNKTLLVFPNALLNFILITFQVKYLRLLIANSNRKICISFDFYPSLHEILCRCFL